MLEFDFPASPLAAADLSLDIRISILDTLMMSKSAYVF